MNQQTLLRRQYAHGKIWPFCKLEEEGAVLTTNGRVVMSEVDAGGDIMLCMTQLNLSARAYHRILKLACTIADLVGSEEIQAVHLAEALHLRSSEVDVELSTDLLIQYRQERSTVTFRSD